MMKEFAIASPRTATGLIYAAGYLTGTLLGLLMSYLISGYLKTGAAIAFGPACGVIALRVAQSRGVVPEAQELNQPISLFGPAGFHGDSRGQ
jgi:hypothetical protein